MGSKGLNRSNKERIARLIAQRLLVIQDGGMDDPATWLRAAARRGHPVGFWHEPGGAVAEYLSAEAGTGVINVNLAYTPPMQARGLVHELAHAEMNILASGLHKAEVPGWLAGEHYRFGYDDNPGDVRHRIAQRVELICFRK